MSLPPGIPVTHRPMSLRVTGAEWGPDRLFCTPPPLPPRAGRGLWRVRLPLPSHPVSSLGAPWNRVAAQMPSGARSKEENGRGAEKQIDPGLIGQSALLRR